MFQAVQAQRWYESSDTLNRKRAIGVAAAQGGLYASTVLGLQFAWYSQYQNGKFRFFNDWPGWGQMDKVGHSATAYQIGTNLYQINRWAGVSKKSSAWYAAGLGFSYQLVIEVMDGFSSGWGFSNYDLAFNTLGSGMFLAQQLGWDEQRLQLKYSFFPSGLTHLKGYEGRRARNLYGEHLYEQWLKDYNGQTYWLSANVWSLIGKPDNFPKWMNLAVGYSVNNFLGAESNSWTDPDDPNSILISSRTRQRQVLLSLDVDLTHVSLPKYLIWVKPIFGVVKFPFPALEWNDQKGLGGHWIYF
ncbi:MAG: DUF2279 domain-containing protein [Salibacteraceae bacterium]